MSSIPGPAMELVRDDEDRETYYLNMGPQHPSTHGVLRLQLHLEGERILAVSPVIGYGHRAHEKMAENRDFLMFLPNTSRIDYLSGMIYNLGYCQAIEKIMGIEVPERAEYIRIIAGELNRISSHLLWLGTYLLDLGGITPFLLRRPRAHPRHPRLGHRIAPYLLLRTFRRRHHGCR